MEKSDDVEFARLSYERIAHERDRIRDARAHFARQLGPLPAFAGISVAFIAAVSEDIKHDYILWLALLAFFVMVVASILYSRMPAYREIRAGIVGREEPAQPRTRTLSKWYEGEIGIEDRIYGDPRERGQDRFWWLPRVDPEEGLQQQLERERFGVFLVQFLFLVVIVLLVLAR